MAAPTPVTVVGGGLAGCEATLQLAARGHSRVVDHSAVGRFSVESPAFRLSRTPASVDRPGPRLGEHTEHVFRDILGVPESEFADLESKGAFE